MRSRLALALASASTGLVLVVAGCTNILGPFTVGDGGADATPDAAGDGPQPVGIACQETGNTRTALTSGSLLHTDKLRMAAIGGNRTRVVVADVQQSGSTGLVVVVRAFTADGNHDVTNADLPTNAGEVYSIARYPTGFAVLYEAQDPTTFKPYLWAAHLEDNAPSWSTPVELIESPNQTGGGSHGATFVAIDGTNDVYMVAYTYASGPTQYVFLGPLSPGDSSMFSQADSFPTLGTDQQSYMFQEPAIAFQPTKPPLVMMTPNGNNGPPSQGAPLKIVMPNNQGFLLTPPSNLNFFPYGFASAVTPTKANLAMLVANLSTFQGGTHVGQVDYGALNASFDPQTLAETALTTDGATVQLEDLFIGNENAHWELAGAAEQLVIMAPPFDPLARTTGNGLNFGWWDGATGANRASYTGPNALGQAITNVAVADATFQTLVGSIAGLQVAYVSDVSPPTNGGGGQPVAGDLWLTGIACQPK